MAAFPGIVIDLRPPFKKGAPLRPLGIRRISTRMKSSAAKASLSQQQRTSRYNFQKRMKATEGLHHTIKIMGDARELFDIEQE